MAISFDTNDAYRGTAPLTATPFTMWVWWRPDVTNDFGGIMSLSDASANEDHWFVIFQSNNDWFFLCKGGGPARNILDNNTVVVGQWTSLCYVSRAADDREAYVDGVSAGTSTFSVTPTNIDTFGLAVNRTNNTNDFSPGGDMKDPTLWNVALTPNEIQELHAGKWPMSIRPANIVYYGPMLNIGWADTDMSGSGNTPGTTEGAPATHDGHPGASWIFPAPKPQEASGAQTVSVGQALETDTVPGVINVVKRRSVVQASETDTAFAVAAQRVIPVGQALETDSAFTITRRKIRSILQAVETNTAFSVTPVRRYAVAQALETDTVPGVMTWKKIVRVGQATELDTALPLVGVQAQAAGTYKPTWRPRRRG